MASTRFNYDECRTEKRLQQSTDPGRYMLDVPGNGTKPYYVSDSHILSQKWGGNLWTNQVDIESTFWGIDKSVGRDCISEKKRFELSTSKIEYPELNTFLTTDQSRATMPAWMLRDMSQTQIIETPLLGGFRPQPELPFSNNSSTRIIEKDTYVQKCNYRR